jgi:pilus assembly protein CpaF
VARALEQIVATFEPELSPATDQAKLVAEMTDEALGLGPLQKLLDDDTVSEIMVVDPNTIYVERQGKLRMTPFRFTDDESCRAAIERIVTPLGRRIDESTPLVDARLEDGSRVNAIIPPLAIRGPSTKARRWSMRASKTAHA